ncbi:MAG: HAMP domain-containing sensor histidine kinase [Bacteroidota bacterium]|nr:HAMP domain-containing sensor histidine kinase [Bacteroidota bacterium]
MSKKRKYIPKKRHNPVVQAQKIDNLSEELDRLGKAIEALSQSHDNHISYLGNFARHDIKNAILSMDSILTVTTPEDFNEESIDTLAIYLKVIKTTMDNFVKLVPYSSKGTFQLPTLLIAVELLTRSDLQKNNIELETQVDRKLDTEIRLPFQSILQMINNLVINSVKALDNIPEKKILLEANLTSDKLVIFISDNGRVIGENEKHKIFDYGYSTTGGSGIGLYHAQYLCDVFDGKIELSDETRDSMTKTFCISLQQ